MMNPVPDTPRERTVPTLRVDALQLLRRSHHAIDELFFAYHLLCERDDTTEGKRALIERLHLEMGVHLQLVEDVVHPALQQGGHATHAELIAEARTAHRSAREMLAAIVASPVDNAERDGRMEALGEFMRRQFTHERSLLFPALRQTGLALDELGACLAQQRQTLFAQYRRALSHGGPPEDESDDPVGQPVPRRSVADQAPVEPSADAGRSHEQ